MAPQRENKLRGNGGGSMHEDMLRRIESLECDVRRLLGGAVLDSLVRIEHQLSHITRMEAKQMAFAQDVLDRITRQTTIIGSIKAWIEALPANTVSDEDKANILANLDANEAELSTAIPANTPQA